MPTGTSPSEEYDPNDPNAIPPPPPTNPPGPYLPPGGAPRRTPLSPTDEQVGTGGGGPTSPGTTAPPNQSVTPTAPVKPPKGPKKAKGRRGGGGGGAQPGAAPAPMPVTGPPPGTDIEDWIMQQLKDVVGSGGPYTPDVVTRMNAAAFSSSQGAIRQAQDAAREDAISRGISRGGYLGTELQNAVLQGRAQYSKTANENRVKATLANYQAKMEALGRAQTWLNSKRDYLLQSERNANDLRVGLAQIQMGYAQIASQEKMLKMKMDFDAAHMGGGGGGGTPGSYIIDPTTGQPMIDPNTGQPYVIH